MSVGGDSVAGHVFNLIQWERYLEPFYIEVWMPLLSIAVRMQTCTIWKDGWQLDLYLYNKCNFFCGFLDIRL